MQENMLLDYIVWTCVEGNASWYTYVLRHTGPKHSPFALYPNIRRLLFKEDNRATITLYRARWHYFLAEARVHSSQRSI